MAVGLPRRVIGSGGVFGPRPDEPYLDMPQRRDSFPQWAEKGWLPVAGDGCGNCYVLTADGTVGFVDTMKDPGRIDRQAAGNLLSFMTIPADRRSGPQQDRRLTSGGSCPDNPIRGRCALCEHSKLCIFMRIDAPCAALGSVPDRRATTASMPRDWFRSLLA